MLAVALVALGFKLVLAARTYGTNDIRHWTDFSRAVRQDGPVGVYKFKFKSSFYNHPPLIGYYLEFVNLGIHVGVPLRFTIRAVSSIADVATALIMFELLRTRTSPARSFIGALGCAASPVLFLVSGFHGNTDPIFVMLCLVSMYCLADRAQPLGAGIALGLAIGVKIVPAVV
ncbi:MAG: rane protein, partial [Pseudonocardiales bacterium]|nr:rane protein [Pseudonocardiales bacterium]